MKLKTILLILSVLLYAAGLSSCRSAHALQATSSKSSQETVSKCNGAIRYYSEKIIAKGEVITANSEVVINPQAKIINLKCETPNGEKASFDTIIETYDCSLNIGLEEGNATYTGYIKQLDGSTTRAVVKVEAKDGSLTIQNGEPGKEGDFVIVISKWEVVTD